MQHRPPPKPLSFSWNVAQNYKTFEQAYLIYAQASGLVDQQKKTQASVLLHVAGEEAIKVFNGFRWEGEAKKEDPKAILEKSKEHCIPLTNVIYERHIFHGRVQHPDEAFDPFYSDLCNLVKTCEYGALSEDVVRDRIVSGIRNDNLREPQLTLKNAVDLCRASEVSDRQSREFSDSPKVQYVKKLPARNNKRTPNPKPAQMEKSCCNCGREPHDRNLCHAKRLTCEGCGKKGHWKIVCMKTKGVRAIEPEYEDDQEDPHDYSPQDYSPHDYALQPSFLGVVSTDSAQRWSTEVDVDGIPVQFKADTGADISVIPHKLYKELFSQKQLKTATFSLRGADHGTLQCEGYWTAPKLWISHQTEAISTAILGTRSSSSSTSAHGEVKDRDLGWVPLQNRSRAR